LNNILQRKFICPSICPIYFRKGCEAGTTTSAASTLDLSEKAKYLVWKRLQ
jgi:hypothetical protein